jgi:hypothetical protein
MSYCTFSKLLKLSRRACDIFWEVPGVRGRTWVVTGKSYLNGSNDFIRKKNALKTIIKTFTDVLMVV